MTFLRDQRDPHVALQDVGNLHQLLDLPDPLALEKADPVAGLDPDLGGQLALAHAPAQPQVFQALSEPFGVVVGGERLAARLSHRAWASWI
jgi:hypothetical protein